MGSYGFVVSANFFALSRKRLDLSQRHAQLIKGNLELALHFIVVSLKLDKVQRLLLDGLLQVDVSLVGDVQGHFQFGDLNLELLLDTLHLSLQPGLRLDHARVELLDFNAVLLAGNELICSMN